MLPPREVPQRGTRTRQKRPRQSQCLECLSVSSRCLESIPSQGSRSLDMSRSADLPRCAASGCAAHSGNSYQYTYLTARPGCRYRYTYLILIGPARMRRWRGWRRRTWRRRGCSCTCWRRPTSTRCAPPVPIPYTLYPIPYTLYPIPYTLNIENGENVTRVGKKLSVVEKKWKIGGKKN